MKVFFRNIPLPMSGLSLGLLSLGNLFKQYDFTFFSYVSAFLGFILLILLLLKIIITPKDTVTQLKSPMILAVSPTFTMATMVATTYINRLADYQTVASLIWFSAYFIQIVTILVFIYYFVIQTKVTWSAIFPSWFILFVGLGIAPITGHSISPTLSEFALILSFVLYLFILPLVLYRLFKIKNFNEGTRPLIAITCAPSSLLLTGFLSLYQAENHFLLVMWLILAQGFYFLVLALLVNIIPKTFYPTWAALTFPFVICATGLKASLPYFSGFPLQFLTMLAYLELLIASIMVCLALFNYLKFLFFLITHKKQA